MNLDDNQPPPNHNIAESSIQKMHPNPPSPSRQNSQQQSILLDQLDKNPPHSQGIEGVHMNPNHQINLNTAVPEHHYRKSDKNLLNKR